MYRVTIFEGKTKVRTYVIDEYPVVVPIQSGQWYDICRIPTDALDYEELNVRIPL